MIYRIHCFPLWFLMAFAASANAAAGARDFLKRPDEWFQTEEARRITTNILSWQSPLGSWPKNTDTASKPFDRDRQKLQGTFDNGATTDELRFVALSFRLTKDARCEEAFLKGLDHIFAAQYANGGWPQFYPPGTKYHRHITFNDGTMVRIMQFLREVATHTDYAFVDAPRRKLAAAAFDRGVQCILKCQVKVGDKLTVWCAQHDEVDFSPRPARTFELASLSGAESAGILEFLMSLDNPNAAVVRAIDAGVAWFNTVKLEGIRQTKVDGDKRVVKDATAPPLWTRFYEIETNRPIFAGRDGEKKYDLAEIERERRNGYAWYGDWGRKLPEDYAKWKQRVQAARVKAAHDFSITK
jgi:PelA/Pel-15E family pectate lyase